MASLIRKWRSRLVTRQRARAAHRLREQLKNSDQLSFTTDYGSTFTSDWRRALAPLIGRPGVRMLEVGSYEGRSAVWFLRNILTDPSAELVCIDPFFAPEREVRFDHNLALVDRNGQVRKRKGLSGDILPTLEPTSFDAIYVDGAHDAGSVLLDAVLSWKLLKNGGVLIFDDYLWELDWPISQRPQLAIDLFRDMMADSLETIHADYQVIVRKV